MRLIVLQRGRTLGKKMVGAKKVEEIKNLELIIEAHTLYEKLKNKK